MKKLWWMPVLMVGVLLCVPLDAWAQVTLPCTRVDTNDMRAEATIWFNNPMTGEPMGSQNIDLDPILAYANNYFVFNDPMWGFAEGKGLTTSMCLIPQGATTSVPQVDTTTSGQATSTGPFIITYVNGNAPTRFRVERNGDVTTGTLYGSMYLVAEGTGRCVTGASVSAVCGSSFVSAMFTGWGWSVYGELETSGGRVQIFDYLPCLNNLYECQEATAEGNVHTLSAGCYADPCAGGGWGFFARRDLSASAWFEVEGP